MKLPWDDEVAAAERKRIKKEAEADKQIKPKRLKAAAQLATMQVNISDNQ